MAAKDLCVNCCAAHIRGAGRCYIEEWKKGRVKKMKTPVLRRKIVSLKGPEPWLVVLAERVRPLMCARMMSTEAIASELQCSLKAVFRAVALLKTRGDIELIRCVSFRRGGVAKMRGVLNVLKNEGLSAEAIAVRLQLPVALVESGLVESVAVESVAVEPECAPPRETFDELWTDWIRETESEAQVLEWTADGL